MALKGRVACEITTADEFILTELLFDGFFSNLDPAESVAILSIFVCQEKSDSDCESSLSPKLQQAVQEVFIRAESIAESHIRAGLPESTALASVARLRTSLVLVVYEWARGMSFKDVTLLTDVLEGIFVPRQPYLAVCIDMHVFLSSRHHCANHFSIG